MELIIILLLIVLIISFYNQNRRNEELLSNLSIRLERIKEETHKLREELKQKPSENLPPKPVQEPEKKAELKEVILPPRPKIFTPPPVTESVPEPPVISRAAVSPVQATAIPVNQQNWFKSWLKNNPDLEKFIGENLINKIGICILVLGIAFFVKYAIDQNWINETGRVCIGLACGAGLTGLAHYWRNGYRSFSCVVACGGIAVFYITIAFAFHQYHLLNQTATFILMVIITAFAVTLSVLYDKLELAVIAAVGGFLTPFMVSSGAGNYIALFIYLIILNSGLLLLSYYKRWKLINIISLIFTVLITGVWMIFSIDQPQQKISYPLALLLITILYFIFLGMNMINQIRRSQAFKAFDFSILLFITGTYFSAGIILLSHVQQGAYQGLFTLSAGLVDLVLARYFFKRKDTDRNLLYLLIGLTLTFLSLAVPIQLHGHSITLFWSAEFVLLFWLYQRSGIQLFKYSSALICILTVFSLILDWGNASVYNGQGLALIFTNLKGIITNIVVAISFASYMFLIKKESVPQYLPGISNHTARVLAITVSLVLIYITCLFGVNLYFQNLTSYEIPNVYYRVVTSLLTIALILYFRGKSNVKNQWLLQALIAVNVLLYLFSVSLVTDFFFGIMAGKIPKSRLWFHWISDVMMIYLLYNAVMLIRKNSPVFLQYIRGLSWIISCISVIILSIELLHIYTIAGYRGNNIHELEHQYSKVILTIIWALCSFALMWLGMRFKNKTLRIVSLSLFFIALMKLVLWDIKNISEGGKIASFILLGVLLLSVSFMYQKLKKIIIDEKE